MRANRSFATLNRTVRFVAIGLAMLVGIGIPAIYGVVAYNGEVARLAYRSDLAARRVAEYAYIQGDAWRYTSHRIAELVAFFYRDDEHQAVFDSRGAKIVDIGQPVAGLTVTTTS